MYVAQDVKMDLLTVSQAAELLGKSMQTIRDWITSGKIPAIQAGEFGKFLIEREKLLKAIEYKPAAKQAQEKDGGTHAKGADGR